MTPQSILSAATTVLEILGMAVVVWGVALLSVPAALVVAGLFLALIGYALDRPTARKAEPR